MTNLLGFSAHEQINRNNTHIEVGHKIKAFLDDIAEDCNLVLEFDNPSGPFEYLFSGTTYSLAFDTDSISVLDFDLDSGESTTLAVFNPHEINRATHWLLTQVNPQNTTS